MRSFALALATFSLALCALGEADVAAEADELPTASAMAAEDACLPGDDGRCSLSLLQRRAAATSGLAAESCAAYGCTEDFDFMTFFTQKCQCFKGCEQSLMGNVCCSDYSATCSTVKVKPTSCAKIGCTKGFDSSQACQCYSGCDGKDSTCCTDYEETCVEKVTEPEEPAEEKKWTRYANAYCSQKHGAQQIGKTKKAKTRQACKKRCANNKKCEGVDISDKLYCSLLKSIKLQKCTATKGRHDTFVLNSRM